MQTVYRNITSTSHTVDPTTKLTATVSVTELDSAAKFQSILHVTDFNDPLSVQTGCPVPELKPDDLLVQNKAVGLNPIDWKGKKYGFGIYHFPWINGRESSGVVIQTGRNVDAGEYECGDRVIVSSTSYRDLRTSTFQQYTAIDSRLVWKLPDSFTYEEGATIGVGLVTAGIIFYTSFDFDLSTSPKQTNDTILIWGGATVVGLFATQLAKLHGLKVIAVADFNNYSYLKSLGVDAVVDRYLSTAEIVAEAQEHARRIGDGTIGYGIDCVSKESSRTVLELLGATNTVRKPLFAGIVGVPADAPANVDVREVVVKRFHEDIEFGKRFVDTTTHFFHDGSIKPARVKQYTGGIHAIDDALKDLETIGAKAEKYVVTL